ncbi:MAG: DNA ligase D [Burkholderiales bacterium]
MTRAEKEDGLARYRAKRNPARTAEPFDPGTPNESARRFVIHKHWASRLHYDFRLEFDGTLKSWAVPKGPSLDPKDKRMAVQVEDHPLSYGDFEGEIARGNYGAGTVIVWDRGVWQPIGDAREGYEKGKLKFELEGEKLSGGWTLVRMHGRQKERQPPWLLIKEKDEASRPAAEYSVVDALPDSVIGKSSAHAERTGPGKAAAKAASRTTPRAKAAASSRTRANKAPAPAREAAASDAAPATNRASTGRRTKKRSLLPLPPSATACKLPASLKPQLATLAFEPPKAKADWFYEIKFDGYRLLARIERGQARLFTRNGHDWTERMPRIAQALQSLPLEGGWLDGEVVLPRDDGIPDFQALQNAFDEDETQRLVYYLFDLPFANGHDLRAAPLRERRAALEALFVDLPKGVARILRFSAALDVRPSNLLASACQLGFEGVIGKRRDSSYVSRRSNDWIKLKCSLRQEFVICGFTDPQGSRAGFGSLILGVHDGEGELRHAGNVGTGFTEKSLADLHRRLTALETKQPPFKNIQAIPAKGRHWVEPKLLAEVAFAAWTSSGRIRHSVFHGLREDKKTRAITREQAALPARPATNKTARANANAMATAKATGKASDNATAKTTYKVTAKTKTKATTKPAADPGTKPNAQANATALAPSFKVTHPERVIDKQSGATKLELVTWYARAADVLMPHLKGRPVALVRAPRGVSGGQFFQKHADAQNIAGVRRIEANIDPRLDPGDGALIEITGAEGLVNLAQLNTIELHTWNACSRTIAKPDRMTFDLDPGDGVAFSKVREGAMLVRALLDELGLPAFLKTSGGKGLHVVVPIKCQHDWDTVKDFSKRIVEHLARTIPARFVAKSGPKNRIGKIFVDYLRNGFGATTVAAWSVRARPGLGISVPIGWDELECIESGDQFTLETIDERLAIGNARWDSYEKARRAIGPAMKKLAAAEPAPKPRKR